jgi:hypothetical protein
MIELTPSQENSLDRLIARVYNIGLLDDAGIARARQDFAVNWDFSADLLAGKIDGAGADLSGGTPYSAGSYGPCTFPGAAPSRAGSTRSPGTQPRSTCTPATRSRTVLRPRRVRGACRTASTTPGTTASRAMSSPRRPSMTAAAAGRFRGSTCNRP